MRAVCMYLLNVCLQNHVSVRLNNSMSVYTVYLCR